MKTLPSLRANPSKGTRRSIGGGPSEHDTGTSNQVSALNRPAAMAELGRKRSQPRRKRILLVDDQQSVREAISLLLSLNEHTVVEASNGAEALDLFTRHRFDLVITDFDMPKMKGNELAARIKQLSPAHPILMITAHVERLGDSNNPVDAILNKPFELGDLRQAMAKLLS
jgi:CheY-like chemotaxis protein